MLDNLVVLEFASVLAGPAVGQFFAELGAEVIKIESPTGDVTRSWKLPSESSSTDRSAYFCAVNWGKKSWVVDLTTSQGIDSIYALLPQVDIVIASYKAGDAEKLGVSYSQLRTRNPRLIYGAISGYGAGNQRVGYDAVLQAEAGFMYLNGEKNGNPLKMPVALIDLLAAHQLKEGLLLALLNRMKTNEGALVEVSLIQAAVSSLANQASNWLIGNVNPQRSGSLHPNIAPYGEVFACHDGEQVVLAIGNDRQFAALCTLLGAGELLADERFSTNILRVTHREHLSEALREKFARHKSTDMMSLIHQQKIPAGLIQSVAQALAMPEVAGLLMENDGMRGVRTFVGRNNNNLTLAPPPRLGEHNKEVLDRIKHL